MGDDERQGVSRAQGCAYYLTRRHGLICRHVESVDLNADHTANWQLQVDFELPTDDRAFLGDQDGEGNCHFLFPLVYLKKSDARTGFQARDEDDARMPVPTRAECNRISGHAAAHAAVAVLEERLTELGNAPVSKAEPLGAVFERIAGANALTASMMLSELLMQVGLEGDPEKNDVDEVWRNVGRAWQESGLVDVLQMLVEHTLIWIPLRGRPGERRSIMIHQRISIVRRAFVRWRFGRLEPPKKRWCHPLQAWRTRDLALRETLDVGEKYYGRRGRRISLSALAERVSVPLAWAPCEYEFPTVHTKRCRSYHFELRCPPGRSPRGLQPAYGPALAERGREAEPGRTTRTARIARHDRPGNDLAKAIWFRVSVGVGDGAFPALWFLTGAITAAMLWVLAANDPTLKGSEGEIMAGVLLIVPALTAALAFGGGNDVPVTQLIGGARILLLVTGLSAVGAAAVLIHGTPFQLDSSWTWSVCAIAATATAVPLGTSWLLSSPFIWSQLKKLRSHKRQTDALTVASSLAAAGFAALLALGDASLLDGVVAVLLLFLTIAIYGLANNRVAMPIGQSRRNVAVALFIAGLACLVVGCIELRAAIDPGPGPDPLIEWIALALAVLAAVIGRGLNPLIRFTGAREDEIHVAPQVGQALLAGEAVAELSILTRREREMATGKEAKRMPMGSVG